MGILIVKGLNARRLYKWFGVKWLTVQLIPLTFLPHSLLPKDELYRPFGGTH
jgi:hypothetical protein